jgi:hypothetical protein
MTITPVGFNPRAGKTIELQHRPPEPDGSPMDPFGPPAGPRGAVHYPLYAAS